MSQLVRLGQIEGETLSGAWNRSVVCPNLIAKAHNVSVQTYLFDRICSIAYDVDTNNQQIIKSAVSCFHHTSECLTRCSASSVYDGMDAERLRGIPKRIVGTISPKFRHTS